METGKQKAKAKIMFHQYPPNFFWTALFIIITIIILWGEIPSLGEIVF